MAEENNNVLKMTKYISQRITIVKLEKGQTGRERRLKWFKDQMDMITRRIRINSETENYHTER